MNQPPNPDQKSANGPARRGSINLVVLGSAAVLAIYGAGYLRTRSAAQRFAASERRSAVAMPATGDSPGAPAVATAAPAPRDTPAAAPTKKTPPARKAKKSVVAARSSDSTPAIPIAVTPPVPVTPVMPVAPPPPPTSGTTDTTKKTADSTASPADTVRARFKDGTYYGFGTSRHGDIEAAVDIKDGRIIFAYITRCLTQYSCSRIDRIVPQVVARQSAEVDYVSGATQSSDAFYYAIVQALSKAKAK